MVNVSTTRQVWWVNQNQTYTHEVRGGYMWSPKVNQNGARNQFYENMTRVQPGDLVLSFSDTRIKAIGVVTAGAAAAPKPTEFGNTGSYWGNEGWYVTVEYEELAAPVRPADFMHLLGPTLPQIYSPLQANGRGNQGVYLTEIPLVMAAVLRDLLGPQFDYSLTVGEATARRYLSNAMAESEIASRTDLPETEKLQLISARRGQGLFKSRVEIVEQECRITKLADRTHLRASHIKPWRDSTDREKLDGFNGLLLSPHVDHLFDRGFISFEDGGRVVVSPKLPPIVLERWSIDPARSVGTFCSEQRAYLNYHRAHVLL